MAGQRQKSLPLLVCLLLAAAPHALGVNVGDEDFSSDVAGTFIVFASKAIHVINPLTLSVDYTADADQDGNALTNAGAVGSKNTTRTWNDAIFVQNQTAGYRFVFVNEGDVYQDSNGSSYSYVTAVDATVSKVVARIRVGARPVHMYGVNSTSKAWSHSDAEGTFYVLSIASTAPYNITVKTVPSFLNNPAHGKLVLNDVLYPLAYGTNVGEQVISKFNLSNDTRIKTFAYNTSLTNTSSCFGTHSAYFSRVNKHVYFECADGTGILEWNTVNDTAVTQHNIAGTLFGTPGDDRIFATNSANSSSTIIVPGVNGAKSTVDRVLSVPSQPGDPVFYSNSSSLAPGKFSDYTAFFPTARNTNKNDIAAAQAAGGSVTAPGYASLPIDCKYSNMTVSTASVGTSTTGLQLATASNGSLLTPQCGACTPGINNTDPTQFNASLAGFGVINLASKDSTTTLLSAGAVAPAASAATTANQCSFASPSRAAKRGGSFVATVADLPQPSIYIADASLPADALYGRGFVQTAPSPKKIVWVPASTVNLSG